MALRVCGRGAVTSCARLGKPSELLELLETCLGGILSRIMRRILDGRKFSCKYKPQECGICGLSHINLS